MFEASWIILLERCLIGMREFGMPHDAPEVSGVRLRGFPFAEKVTPHIIKTDTVNDKITAKVKVFQYIFDGVTEVHEIPDKNTASVKAKLVRPNETPFFTEAFEKKNKKEIIKTLPFRKTTDGWKLCD